MDETRKSYGVKMEYRPKGQGTWRETVLRNRFADRTHAERFVAEMNARGGRAQVVDLEGDRVTAAAVITFLTGDDAQWNKTNEQLEREAGTR